MTLYLSVLFILSRILEAVAYYEGGYLSSRLLDPVSLSVRKLKAILDQRGVGYTGVVEQKELTELVTTSGICDMLNVMNSNEIVYYYYYYYSYSK